MQNQELKHCCVLVADDSASSRTLLATTLNDIGVGTVHTVPNGVAAIDHLRRSGGGESSAKPPMVDLLITEWDMDPVGGMMLIHWLRRHRSSPDRFTRTMIMSGDMDTEKVERARNAGVNAVFAKPFTINGLRKHVVNVLSANPPYFKTTGYFGPDRRRHGSEIVLDERRQVRKPYGEVLDHGPSPEVGCFDLPHYLSEMARGRGPVDYTERDWAHEVLAPHSEDYADWVQGDVEVLRLAFRLADQNPDLRARNMGLMAKLVFRLEREGVLLGYPLISAFALTLANAIQTDAALWCKSAEIFDAALNGLDVVVRQDVRGDGGVVGKALSSSLRGLNKKLIALRPPATYHRRRAG